MKNPTKVEKKKRRSKYRTKVYQSGLYKKIFNRDKYRCRYCKKKVVDTGMLYARAYKAMQDLLDLVNAGKLSHKQYIKTSDSQELFRKEYRENTKILATIDHVIPIALGGSDEEINLVTACLPCNLSKGKKLKYG